MKRQIKLYILLAILGLVMASPATAGEWIFGAKTGRTVINDSAIKTHPTSVGFMVGYQQGLVLGDFAIEGEITNTVSDAELDASAGGGKFKVSTKAIYAAFRSAGPIYLKAKGGYLQADFDGTTESGSSYGVGLGFGIGIMQLELELTKTAVDPDILFASVGVQF